MPFNFLSVEGDFDRFKVTFLSISLSKMLYLTYYTNPSFDLVSIGTIHVKLASISEPRHFMSTPWSFILKI